MWNIFVSSNNIINWSNDLLFRYEETILLHIILTAQGNHRGGWPFIYRVGNLPEALSNEMKHGHVTSLHGSQYISLDTKTNTIVRTVRQPQSLEPALVLIAHDLYKAYHRGLRVRDYSLASPAVFTCLCVLLNCFGDYPACAKMTLMKHSGNRPCHWCNIHCPKLRETRSHPVRGHIRMLGMYS